MFQPIDLSIFLACIVGVILLALLGLQAWYDRRDSILVDHRRLNTVFSCRQCALVFVRPRRREEASCPQCGTSNTRLKF